MDSCIVWTSCIFLCMFGEGKSRRSGNHLASTRSVSDTGGRGPRTQCPSAARLGVAILYGATTARHPRGVQAPRVRHAALNRGIRFTADGVVRSILCRAFLLLCCQPCAFGASNTSVDGVPRGVWLLFGHHVQYGHVGRRRWPCIRAGSRSAMMIFYSVRAACTIL